MATCETYQETVYYQQLLSSGWFISQKIVQPWFKQTISQLVELEQEKLLSSLYLNLLNFHIAVPTNYIETVSQFFRSPIYPYS